MDVSNESLEEKTITEFKRMTVRIRDKNKFNSFYEANISCNEWKEEAGTYVGVIKPLKKNERNKTQPEYLFKRTGKFFLEPANSEYDAIQIDIDIIIFQGRLLAIWRKV